MEKKSIITFILVTLGVLVGVTALLWNFGSQQDKPVANVAGESRHTKGEGSVEVVEFSDLQCPACKAIHEPLKELLNKYEGKVRFVYRHFPLTSIHKNSMVASYASEAAHMQGQFWEMQDLLFANQTEWEGLDDPKEKFVAYAGSLGLDTAKFLADMEGQVVKDNVNLDLVDATRFRLAGTPSFFVNGVPTEFNQLESKIEDSLR